MAKPAPFIHKRGPGLLEQSCNLIEGLLTLLAARTANWEVTPNWCSACSRLGAVLHAEADRCICVCHPARDFLKEHRAEEAAPEE